MDLGAPLCRLGDPRKDFEQRALPRPVATNDADHLAVFDFEGDVLEGPDVAVARRLTGDRGPGTGDGGGGIEDGRPGTDDGPSVFRPPSCVRRSRRNGEAKASVMTSRRAL